MTRIRAFGGLANRLRVVLSYRAAFGPLEIVWRPDGEIAYGRFLDVFEPLHGVTFLDEAICGTKTLDPYPAAPADWQRGYSELRLRREWEAKLTYLLSPTVDYSAIHIRRTDHVQLAKACGTYTDDDAFRKWLRACESTVYVAADNGTTQAAYLAYLAEAGRASIVYEVIPEHPDQDKGGRRNTTLAHCAVDLFACVRAKSFMGSGESSFTNLVHTLRAL
jgi:hypothetical protein